MLDNKVCKSRNKNGEFVAGYNSVYRLHMHVLIAESVCVAVGNDNL